MNLKMREKTSCQKALINKINSQVCSFDAFGEPIGFNYKGSKTYQTFIGGFFTILARILILIYFISKVVEIVGKESTITNTQSFIQTNVDTRKLILDKDDIDYAVVLQNYNISYSKEEFNLYLNLRPEFTRYTYVDGETQFVWDAYETEKCDAGRLKNTSAFYYYYQEPEPVFCHKNLSMELYRSLNSLQTDSYSLGIYKCTQYFLDKNYPGQNLTCKSPEEISQFISTASYTLLIMNSYFDTEEFDENPIKPFGFYKTNALFDGYTDYYLFEISENKAYVQDSWLQSYVGDKEYTYYQVSSPQQSYQQLEDIVVLFTFTVSEHVQTIERVRKNVIDSLSETGGIIEIIFLFISFFLSSYEHFKHNSELIFQLFQVDEAIGAPQKPGQVGSDVLKGQTEASLHQSSQVSNDLLLDGILKMIKKRTQFVMRYHEILLRYFWCLCNKRVKQKIKVYRKGKEKLESTLDIVNVVREVRNMVLIQQIILSKYQKTLIPYFHSQLIEIEDPREGDQVEPSQSERLQKIEQYLKQVILNSCQDKIDRKILKQLSPLKAQKQFTKGLQILQHQYDKNLQSLWYGHASQKQLVSQKRDKKNIGSHQDFEKEEMHNFK